MEKTQEDTAWTVFQNTELESFNSRWNPQHSSTLKFCIQTPQRPNDWVEMHLYFLVQATVFLMTALSKFGWK